jgi:acetylornithine/succinyldiaminopimelate/putrescine aminotransferase
MVDEANPGEPGVIIPPPGYLADVRELCNAYDVMPILDEIHTGLGRTGKLLAEQHGGIEVDATLLGKALSGGFYPVTFLPAKANTIASDNCPTRNGFVRSFVLARKSSGTSSGSAKPDMKRMGRSGHLRRA